MAAMADFARMPTRQKVMTFVVIGLLLGLIYRQFVYKSLKEDVEAAEGEHDAQKALNRKLELEIPEYQKLKERMVTITKIIEENQKALPTEAELPAFFETLNRKVLESGVEVIRSAQGREESIESFVKVPIDYEIQGTFVQIEKFFASLVPKKKRPSDAGANRSEIPERERIVSVENLSLNNPIVRNREIRLTARFTASTYRQDEKGQAAAKPGAPTKPHAPPAAGNPSPAAAGTPKGAREQTEKALDKGDNRNREATGAEEAKTPSGSGSGAQRMKGGL